MHVGRVVPRWDIASPCRLGWRADLDNLHSILVDKGAPHVDESNGRQSLSVRADRVDDVDNRFRHDTRPAAQT